MTDGMLLEVRNLQISYDRRSREDTRVVRDVSFAIAPREILALVGESGSGKTTVARAVVGLISAEGEILFGSNREPLDSRRSHQLRRRIAMVFQDPRSSLNPRKNVEGIIREAWSTHPDIAPKGNLKDAAVQLLHQVGLTETVLTQRPSRLSGGQCQRVSIARALALEPELIVCDEAVSALDVSIQAQILRLLLDLREARGISLLFITHDLGVVRQIADRVAVMEKGELVEQGPTEWVFDQPRHSYTRTLLNAALDIQID